jgi:DHA1 family tetracycline resistance protein-like MFS transporter
MRVSPLLLMFITILIDLVGFGIIIPVLPYYTRSFGADAFVLGALLASYSVMQFLFAPILGRLSDRVGRKPVLALSMLGTAVASVLMGVAHLAIGLPLLFVARLLDGATGGNISTAQAYIADVTPPEKRAMGMGLIGMAFGLGFVLGPAIGGDLSVRFGIATPFYVVGAVALLNAAAMWSFLPEPERHRGVEAAPQGRLQALLEALRRKETALPILIFFFSTYAFANMEATLALLALDRFGFSARQTGLLFGYTGLLLAMVQGGLIRRLVPRFGEQVLVAAGMLVTASGLLLIGVSGHLVLLFLAMALLALGQGMSNTALSSLVSRLTPRDRQGTSLGLTQSMGSLGRILGPLTGGFLYSHAGTASPYYFGGVMMLGAWGLAMYHRMQVVVSLPAGVE